VRQQEDIPADLGELIRLGSIATVDLAAGKCAVRYGDPDDDGGGAVTPPIRWLALRAGRTRSWSPPSIGEQAIVLVPDGQLAGAVALVGIYSEAFPAPGATLAELVEYADGARIGYDPEAHALTAILPAGGTVAIDAPGGITLRGPVTIEGNLSVQGDASATGDVKVSAISLRDHKHEKVQPGSGVTGGAI
jgi:phage baseplate assembly protein V